MRAIVPLSVGSYLLNEKRRDVAEIERRTNTHLVIVPTDRLETPHYEVQRIRDDLAEAEAGVASYELARAQRNRCASAGTAAHRATTGKRRCHDRTTASQPIADSARWRSLQSRLLSRIFGSIFEGRTGQV